MFGSASRFGLRTAATTILGAITGTATLALVPLPSTWPLTTGFGGLVGDVLRGVIVTLAGGLGEWRVLAAGLSTGLLSLGLVLHACGLIAWQPPRPKRVGRAIAPSGEDRDGGDDDLDFLASDGSGDSADRDEPDDWSDLGEMAVK